MLNPIEASEQIKEEFIGYITTSFQMADEEYSEQFRRELHREGLIAKGPYLEVSDSFVKGKSISSLIEEGIMSTLFGELEGNIADGEKELQLNRTLYLHQEEAVRKANKNHNLVVTTGTGSGKTECFTIPIIDYLLKEKEQGKLDDGVRAILIYPMNALANDQMKRLRATLKNYQDITFGIYNRDTEPTDAEGITSYGKIYKDENGNALKPLRNEVISRKTMQEHPPHILVTNYAMLEYMMLRPKDDLVFSGVKLHFIVLDEAHTYKGATGMETSLLIRRLKARISNSNDVVHILTSATLGGKDTDDDIIAFARNLCEATFLADDIIRSKPEKPHFINPEIDYPLTLFSELANPHEPLNDILDRYGVSYDSSKSDEEIIYDLCLDSKQYRALRSVSTRAMTVSQITTLMRKYQNYTSEDVVNIISVASKGEKDKTALIKARYHMFIRALEGAFITVGRKKELLLERKTFYPDIENTWKVFEAIVCNDCGHLGVIGREIANHLELPGNRFANDLVHYLLRGRDEEFDEDEDTDENDIGENDYLLCPRCGEIHHVSQKCDFLCKHDLNEAVRVFKATKITASGDCKCPSCLSGNLKSFYLGYDAATAVLATSLFEQIPESELILKRSEFTETNEFDLFGTGKIEQENVIKRKKQFLSFSDSRSEAAYFASYMSKYYKEFLRRRGILHVIEKNRDNMSENPWDVKTIVEELTSYFNANRSFAEPGDTGENLTAISKKQAWIAILNELVNSRRTTSLASLGILNFVYKGNEGTIMNAIAKKYNKDVDAMKALFNILVMEFVYNGAVESSKCDLTDDEREYVFFTTKPHRFKLCKDAETDKNKVYLHGWIPRKKSNQTYYYNGRVKRVMETLEISEDEAVGILDSYWRSVLIRGQFPLKTVNNNEFYIDADSFIVIPGTDEHRVYECEKCGRVTMFNVYNACSSVKCNGKLRNVSHSDLIKNNHFARLYSTPLMKPLHIKEHTAQLGREQQQKYQEMFIKKDINALSCSTTFEMGVDVGDLETVYLRNMPPSPANYVQRAGRAGRSLHSAAYALTYSKLSSHDFTYFKDPIQMISGKIGVPVFTIKNEKVIQRHIFAVALSSFFAENVDVYNKNNAHVFLNCDGVARFISFLESKPLSLKTIIKASIPEDMHISMGVDDFSWIERLIGQEGVLTIAVEDYRETIKWYEDEARRLREEGDEEGALRAITKLKQFRRSPEDGKGKNDLIEFLARNNVLPKYGFPIDTVELYQNNNSKDNKLQIVRDLQLAISEYAPDSQVVADDTLYTSRYIRKLPQKTGLDWELNYIALCKEPSCKTWNWKRTEPCAEGELCVSCQKSIEKARWQPSIEPRKGFIAEAKTSAVPMTKPDRLYGSDAYYIGDPQRHVIDKYDFVVQNDAKIFMETSSNDSLMIVCNSDFFVCSRCGFSRSVAGTLDNKNNKKNNIFKKSLDEKHKSPWGKDCEGTLYKHKLSHTFKTDVVKIVFGDSKAKNINVMLSVMYALLESTANVLDIERNDIKGCLHRVKFEGRIIHSIILYDAVAGGAGHVRRLVSDDGKKIQQVIREAIALTKKCTCRPSCYNCLRNYYNQKVHDVLSRQEASMFLEKFVGVMTPYDRSVEQEGDAVDDKAEYPISALSMGNKIDCVGADSWNSLNYIYPDNYAKLFEDFEDKHIPLPDYALVSVSIISHNIDSEILFMWKEKKIMIFDDDQLLLRVEGWTSLSCKEINVIKFSKLF